jgi:hypothetical protein
MFLQKSKVFVPSVLIAASLLAAMEVRPAFSQSGSVHQPTEAEINSLPVSHSEPVVQFQYRRFLDHVCQVDSCAHDLQRRRDAGKATSDTAMPPPESEYETEVGLEPNDVSTILSIARDGCRALQANMTRFIQIRSRQTQPSYDDELKDLGEQHREIIDGTRRQLEDSLEPPEFKKLDDWVLRFGRSASPSHGFGCAAQPSEGGNGSGADAPARRPDHLQHQSALRIRYMFFLIHLGTEDKNIRFFNSEEGQAEAQRLEASGQIVPRTRQPYSSMIGLTQEEVDQMVSICLAGWAKISDTEKKAAEISAQHHAQYTPRQIAQMPVSADLEALNDQRWSLVEETVHQLHDALGDESFQKLDAWVSRHYWRGR